MRNPLRISAYRGTVSLVTTNQLPGHVAAALEAAGFKPDPFSFDWVAPGRFATTALNPWDAPGTVAIPVRRIEYRYDDGGVRYVAWEASTTIVNPELARILTEWQQTLPEHEAPL